MKHLMVAAARSEVTCSASEQGMRAGVVNDAVRRTVELCGMPAPGRTVSEACKHQVRVYCRAYETWRSHAMACSILAARPDRLPWTRQPTPFGSNYKSCFAYAVPLA
ncbi:MAG: hypothetical protein MO847_01235 [Candidatus Protistobacter heckmanni]|nr:hypothetical protein [Candidatus Protistobacter heckmanni]